ncbi:unnamed protein product [Prorocentrum cordatum]|uniref:Uncharacterized protein n=1 Tax=Prorocentrum cordatum TaxID=2364126 RepID=A0ABN9VEX1_9DINO|nr:unnamed protein product [Polarella glacialis]
MDNHGRNIITCGIQICGHGDTNRCAIDANVSAHVGTNTEDGEEEGGTSVEDSRRQGPGKPTTSQADFQDRPSDQQFAKPGWDDPIKRPTFHRSSCRGQRSTPTPAQTSRRTRTSRSPTRPGSRGAPSTRPSTPAPGLRPTWVPTPTTRDDHDRAISSFDIQIEDYGDTVCSAAAANLNSSSRFGEFWR